jgi:hypothetical protein
MIGSGTILSLRDICAAFAVLALTTGCAESVYVAPPPPPGQQKVAVCHKGKKTLWLPPAAVDAHLAHGDTLGPCPRY